MRIKGGRVVLKVMTTITWKCLESDENGVNCGIQIVRSRLLQSMNATGDLLKFKK